MLYEGGDTSAGYLRISRNLSHSYETEKNILDVRND